MLSALLSLGVADARLPQFAAHIADARLPQFTWSSDTDTVDDHTAFGTALGAHFKATIQARFADLRAHGQLGQMLQTYNTSAGSALYDGFLQTHERLAPSAIAELRGLAAGAAVPFEQISCRTSRSSSPTAARRAASRRRGGRATTTAPTSSCATRRARAPSATTRTTTPST